MSGLEPSNAKAWTTSYSAEGTLARIPVRLLLNRTGFAPYPRGLLCQISVEVSHDVRPGTLRIRGKGAVDAGQQSVSMSPGQSIGIIHAGMGIGDGDGSGGGRLALGSL